MHDSIPIDIKIEVDLEVHIAKTPLLMLQTVNRLRTRTKKVHNRFGNETKNTNVIFPFYPLR